MSERIRRAREKTGMSLNAFAREHGIDPGYLHRMENSKKPINPPIETVKKLAKALGVSIDYLAGMYEEAR
jgi:transcriptional regulator with XRE-family HTH domain